MQEIKNVPITLDKDISKSNIIISQNIGDLNHLEQRILDDFVKSGISDKTILEYAKSGYLVGMPDGWKLYYPNFYENTVTDYYNWRRFDIKDGESKYIKPSDMTSRLFRPLALSFETFADKNSYIIITEGEKKAIKATQEGFYCVAISGVYSWKRTPKEDEHQEKEDKYLNADIIPDIANADFTEKTIYMCFDNDMLEKYQVKKALYSFSAYLMGEKKAIVKIIELPKDDEKLGLDDYLVKYGNEEFKKLMDNAQTLTLKLIQAELSGVNKNSILFPTNIFSNPIKELVADLSKRLDAPPEYIATTLLTTASMLMNYRFAINVNPSSNWVEYPILWCALVGNPSQKKTPCLKIGKGIIDEYDQLLQNEYEKKLEIYNNEYAEYKLSIDAYKTALKKGNVTGEPPQEPQKPLKPHLAVQNATVEALCYAIKANEEVKRPVNIFPDELAHLLKGFNQYKNGGNDTEYFLQCWDASRQTIIRQKGETDYTITVSHNILGSIQDKTIDETLFAKGIDSSNGMIERWLFCLTEYMETGDLPVLDKPYNISEFKKLCDKLFFTSEDEKVYHLSTPAQNRFREFCKSVAKIKRSNKLSNLAKNYLQKQTNYVARFALILHCLETPENMEIQDRTIKNAIVLSRYFFACFDKLTSKRMSANPLEDYALAYLRTKNRKTISATELRKSNISRYKTLEVAHITLENLANKGYGRLCKTGTRGNKFIFYE